MDESYIERYSCGSDDVLAWLEKQTHLRTNYARMLCGPAVGKFLEFFVASLNYPAGERNVGCGLNILELGTFTGYSSICMARGLGEKGKLYSIEINDELEDLILQAYEIAGVREKVSLFIGDAKEIIERLGKKFDLILIDANKREYPAYYELALKYLKTGGYIIADNVLWSGKVMESPMPSDAQTQGIHKFNELVKNDSRVENVIIPIRDGLNIIRKISE